MIKRMEGAKRSTEATRAFVAGVGRGEFYVLSREGRGFGFSGHAADEAERLAAANFKRAASLRPDSDSSRR